MTENDWVEEEVPHHIRRLLREPVPLDRDVRRRVMDAAVAEAPMIYPPSDAAIPVAADARGWWRRPIVHLSPLGTLAMAAGLVGIAVMANLRERAAPQTAASAPSQPVATAAPPETVHVVRFVYRNPNARQVTLVGDFNGWTKDATPLVERQSGGAWEVTVTLPRGRHEYAFIVDGTVWSPDPFAQQIADDFGTQSSVVTVGRSGGDPAPSERRSD